MGEIHCTVCGAVCPDGDEWFQDDWRRKHRLTCHYGPVIDELKFISRLCRPSVEEVEKK